MNERSTADRADADSISVTELSGHVARGDAFVLDVRGATHGSQIYGSIRYDPKKLLEAARLMLPLPKSDGLIVLYDEDGTSERLEQVARKLRDGGYASPHTLEGGFAAWRDAGERTEEASIEQPVPLVSEHQLER